MKTIRVKLQGKAYKSSTVTNDWRLLCAAQLSWLHGVPFVASQTTCQVFFHVPDTDDYDYARQLQLLLNKTWRQCQSFDLCYQYAQEQLVQVMLTPMANRVQYDKLYKELAKLSQPKTMTNASTLETSPYAS